MQCGTSGRIQEQMKAHGGENGEIWEQDYGFY